jgi:hypothetical protein
MNNYMINESNFSSYNGTNELVKSCSPCDTESDLKQISTIIIKTAQINKLSPTQATKARGPD